MNTYDVLDSIPFSITFREDTSGSFLPIALKDYTANQSMDGTNNGSGQARQKVTFKVVADSVNGMAKGDIAKSDNVSIDTFMEAKGTDGTEAVYTIAGISSGPGIYKAIAILDGSGASNGASPLVKVETIRFAVTNKQT